ncbi:hypothetical protein FDUTEX481_07774 [Tolypothrix sp. PCC 7601]|nr:hypothetical protein FDUTEX481_07774 [Tolypothrix sp. PCC 7601]
MPSPQSLIPSPQSPVPNPQSLIPITPYPQRGPRVPQSPHLPFMALLG